MQDDTILVVGGNSTNGAVADNVVFSKDAGRTWSPYAAPGLPVRFGAQLVQVVSKPQVRGPPGFGRGSTLSQFARSETDLPAWWVDRWRSDARYSRKLRFRQELGYYIDLRMGRAH